MPVRAALLLWRSAIIAVLGLPSGRRSAPSDRRRTRAVSSYEAPAEAVNPLQFGRASQLPPFGRGNGIEALFWTVAARVPGGRTDAALHALALHGVAGWASAAPPARGSDPAARTAPHDVYVASVRLHDAEDVLAGVLAG